MGAIYTNIQSTKQVRQLSRVIPDVSTSESWLRVAYMKDPGQSAGNMSFMLNGAGGYGSDPVALSNDIIQVQARGITTDSASGLTTAIVNNHLQHTSIGDSNVASYRFGLVPITKSGNATVDFYVYLAIQAYTSGMSIALLSNSPNYAIFYTDEGLESTEPTGIVYATKYRAYSDKYPTGSTV